MSRRIPIAALAVLGFASLLPAAPAEASEVVKLARLVITGKRLSAEPRDPPAPVEKTQQTNKQLPPVLIEGQSHMTLSRTVQLADNRRGQFGTL